MTEARVLQLVAAGQRPMIPLANYADYSGGGAGGGVPMMPMSIANGVSVPLANIIECCWAQVGLKWWHSTAYLQNKALEFEGIFDL